MSVQACYGVNQEAENAVMNALANNHFDFRSVEGLTKETGFPSQVVKAVLRKRSSDVRVSPLPDAQGNTLYTLKTRPRKVQELVSEALAFISGSAR